MHLCCCLLAGWQLDCLLSGGSCLASSVHYCVTAFLACASLFVLCLVVSVSSFGSFFFAGHLCLCGFFQNSGEWKNISLWVGQDDRAGFSRSFNLLQLLTFSFHFIHSSQTFIELHSFLFHSWPAFMDSGRLRLCGLESLSAMLYRASPSFFSEPGSVCSSIVPSLCGHGIPCMCGMCVTFCHFNVYVSNNSGLVLWLSCLPFSHFTVAFGSVSCFGSFLERLLRSLVFHPFYFWCIHYSNGYFHAFSVLLYVCLFFSQPQ